MFISSHYVSEKMKLNYRKQDIQLKRNTAKGKKRHLVVQRTHARTHSQCNIICNTNNHNTLTYTGQTLRCCIAHFTSHHKHTDTNWGFVP